MLFGNDRNRNGLLDPQEDRGDGRLDEGLAALLTCDSAVRNRTADGSERVNINKAEASELQRKLSGISQQQAQSIVEQRKKQQFGSIAELLDVKLVEKQQNKSGQDGKSGRQSDGGQTTAAGAEAGQLPHDGQGRLRRRRVREDRRPGDHDGRQGADRGG